MSVSFKSFLLLFIFTNLSIFSSAQNNWHPLKYLYSENAGWINIREDKNNPNVMIFSYNNGKSEKTYKLYIKVQGNKILFLSNSRIDREIILQNPISSPRDRVDSFGKYSYVEYESTVLIRDKGFQRKGPVEFGTMIINNRKHSYLKTLEGQEITFIW